LQRILASARISQHAKLNMAGFVLSLQDHVGLRCRMVEFHSQEIEFTLNNEMQAEGRRFFLLRRRKVVLK
jgi:hypothetical protein